MLFSYLQQCQRFINDAKQELINPIDLITFVNEARRQLAGEAECLVQQGTLPITSGTQNYQFSMITFATGIAGALNVRTLWYQVATVERVWIAPRPWPWFSIYNLKSPAIPSGPPAEWSQYGPGTTGSVYLSPLPDQSYTIIADSVCYPSPLVTDSDLELLPGLWTDAVPYYAAYLALLSMETPLALQAADKMYQRYHEYVIRGRLAATSDILPRNYQQSSPMPANQLAAPTRGGP